MARLSKEEVLAKLKEIEPTLPNEIRLIDLCEDMGLGNDINYMRMMCDALRYVYDWSSEEKISGNGKKLKVWIRKPAK